MLDDIRDQYFFRTGLLVGFSTLVLTATFVGLLAFIEGHVPGLDSRIPWYLVASALGFTTTILFLEQYHSDGRMIITSAAIVTVASLILLSLSVEGLLFAVDQPEKVFVSQLVLYFFAASLLSTGFGYWGLKHWREFTDQRTGSGL